MTFALVKFQIAFRLKLLRQAIKHRIAFTLAKHQKRLLHWEHYGFVSYAACETFRLHDAIYWVSVSLLVTGILVILGHDIIEVV